MDSLGAFHFQNRDFGGIKTDLAGCFARNRIYGTDAQITVDASGNGHVTFGRPLADTWYYLIFNNPNGSNMVPANKTINGFDIKIYDKNERLVTNKTLWISYLAILP